MQRKLWQTPALVHHAATHKSTKVTLMPKQIHTSTVGHVKPNVADEDKCKSHLVIENDSSSSVANLAVVADSTDIAGLIRRHIFEAKSISKQPANAPLWIKSRADLQIPITLLILTAKYTTRGRQTGRHTHTDRWADKKDGEARKSWLKY